MIYTTVWDFYLGKEIGKSISISRKKALLIASLAGNLSLLGFFKYADFAITQFNILGNHFDLSTHIPLLNLALPIGISFYTFHSMGYIIDVYRGNVTPSKSLREYAIFVSFFPQLVAGPILRAGQFLPQLREKMEQFDGGARLRQILIQDSNLKLGITMMVLGFFKKMFFADNIAPMVNTIFSNPIGLDSFTIILGTIGFGIQIYADFSGYSDIAIGAAMIMGFKIPANFNKPYFATSPSDFWRRWHISLSTWVRDYLYFPLVFHNRKSDMRIALSLMMSFFLIGLWHGAAWHFVIWGMLHGIYVISDTIIRKKIPFLRLHTFFKTKIGSFFSIFVTQYLVFFSYIAFRVNDFDHMVYSMKKYVFLDFSTIHIIEFIKSYEIPTILILLFVLLHFISYKKGNMSEQISHLKLRYWFVFLTPIILLIMLFYGGKPGEFIYFQF